MSDARSDILGAVKSAIKQAGGLEKADTTAAGSASGRLGDPRANLIPARGRLGTKARVDLFIREAEQASASVARVSSLSGVPREVARFLAKNNLPMALKVAPGIAERIVIAESAIVGQTVPEYSPNSPACGEFLALAGFVMERLNEKS